MNALRMPEERERGDAVEPVQSGESGIREIAIDHQPVRQLARAHQPDVNIAAEPLLERRNLVQIGNPCVRHATAGVEETQRGLARQRTDQTIAGGGAHHVDAFQSIARRQMRGGGIGEALCPARLELAQLREMAQRLKSACVKRRVPTTDLQVDQLRHARSDAARPHR